MAMRVGAGLVRTSASANEPITRAKAANSVPPISQRQRYWGKRRAPGRASASDIGSSAAPPPAGGRPFDRGVLLEQFGQLLGHGAAELLGIDDGDGAAIIARDVMADADGDQLPRR